MGEKILNICFDSKGIIAAKNRGIGNYTINIIKSIIEEKPENNYFLISWTDESIKKIYFNGVKIYEINCPIDWGTSWGSLTAKAAVIELLEKYKIDVFIDAAPVIQGYIEYDKIWFGNTLLLGVVYDFIPLIFAERMISNFGGSKYIRSMLNQKRYDYLISISENTRLDAIKFLNISPDKVINCSMDGNRYSPIGNEEKNIVRRKYKLNNRYYFSAVWFEYHKNLERLLEAYGLALSEDYNIPDLVLSGKIPVKYSELIEEKLDKYRMNDKIHFIGFVTDDEMNALYAGAEWLIFPSLYEGFGMSVLEAWRHSVPVITSNNSSLGEIAADAAILVEPTEVDSIRHAIKQTSSMTEEERNEYIKKGIKRANDFSWNATAKRILELIDNVKFEFISDKYIEIERDIAKLEARYLREIPLRINQDATRKLQGRSMIIFGAGNYGRKLYDIMPRCLTPQIKCFCDNTVRGKVKGLEVISLDEAKEKYENAIYIIASKYSKREIFSQLLKSNIPDTCIMECEVFGEF